MINRWFLFLIIILGLASCEKIFNKVNNNVEIKKQSKPIDFTSVDAYPLLPECNGITSRELQKDCFYRYLSKQIESSLSKKNIIIDDTVLDTIKVKINISSKGIISVKSINLSNTQDLLDLKKVIILTIDEFPQIQPAIKYGIPVTTEFVLPIVLKPNS